MKIKEGVIINGLKPIMRPALIICERIFKKYNIDFVITSVVDGEHSAYSLHYYGLAFDFRNYWWNPLQKKKVLKALGEIKIILGKYYDIIYEKNHIHVELKDYLNYFLNPDLSTYILNKEFIKW